VNVREVTSFVYRGRTGGGETFEPVMLVAETTTIVPGRRRRRHRRRRAVR